VAKRWEGEGKNGDKRRREGDEEGSQPWLAARRPTS